VISSPSSLLSVPVIDTAKEAANAIKGIFGKAEPWPRHSEPGRLPERFGVGHQFKLERQSDGRADHEQRGDHVAIMSFTSAGGGVDFGVSYYAISDDKALAKSRSTGNYKLRVT
jgi:hypothetical protein